MACAAIRTQRPSPTLEGGRGHSTPSGGGGTMKIDEGDETTEGPRYGPCRTGPVLDPGGHVDVHDGTAGGTGP